MGSPWQQHNAEHKSNCLPVDTDHHSARIGTAGLGPFSTAKLSWKAMAEGECWERLRDGGLKITVEIQGLVGKKLGVRWQENSSLLYRSQRQEQCNILSEIGNVYFTFVGTKISNYPVGAKMYAMAMTMLLAVLKWQQKCKTA